MKKQLLLLFLVIITFGYSQELLIVDLTTTNEITITSTTNNAAATVSGSDTTGFYFDGFFTSAQVLNATLVSGDLTSASETSDHSPSLYRGSGGSDAGLNVWSYTNDPNSNFTMGQQAFSGQATWSLSTDEYNSMLNAPTSGNIYFPADTSDDIPSATLLGTYSVLTNLSVSDFDDAKMTYYPNPVNDELNISAQKVIVQVDIFNMLGQTVNSIELKTLNGKIDTSGLKTGTYFFKVTLQDGETDTLKLFKR